MLYNTNEIKKKLINLLSCSVILRLSFNYMRIPLYEKAYSLVLRILFIDDIRFL